MQACRTVPKSSVQRFRARSQVLRSNTRTSQPLTSFIISRSRARAACSLRYASRSPSASSMGVKYILDHSVSLLSSLRVQYSVPVADRRLALSRLSCFIAHLFSRFPRPTLQNPKADIAATPSMMTAPPGPRKGRFLLYRTASYPPGGGMSLEH